MSDEKITANGPVIGEYESDFSGFDPDSILENDIFSGMSDEPYEPEMEKRRMELIKRETISGDYEHKYLAEDYKDVIDEEKRRKDERARKIADFTRSFSIRELEEEEKKSSGDMDKTRVIPSVPKVPKVPGEEKKSLSALFMDEIKESEEKKNTEEEPPEIEEPSHPEELLTEKEKKKLKKREKRIERDKKKNRITEEDEDEFQRKYEELKKRGLGVQSSSERRSSAASEAFDEVIEEMEQKTSSGRTFSEKAEESPYEDDDFFRSAKRAKKIPDVVTDKSGLVSYTQGDKADEDIRLADDPLDSITGNSVDKIINEYEKNKTYTAATLRVGDKTNTIENIFDKLLAPDSDEALSEHGSEMLESMKKAKRERLNRTDHVPPVSRPSPSELELDLEDKIIHDTLTLDEEKDPEEKALSDLNERRSKKIKDFVFMGDEDDSGEISEEDEETPVIDDFENMDDAASIAEDITHSKNSMIVRLLILAICFILSFCTTVSNELSAPVFEFVSMTSEPGMYLFVNTIIGMIAAFASYNAISAGFMRLFTLKANCDSFAAVTSIITIMLSMAGLLDTELVRAGVIHEYVPLGIGALIFNTVGKLLLLDRTERNFRYVSGDVERCAIFTVKNEEKAEAFTRGSLTDFPVLAAMKKTDMISDFMKTSYSPDLSDRFCKTFTPIILIASFVIGIIGGAAAYADFGKSALFVGITSFVACLCLCSCYSAMLIVNLPMQKASKKYSALQGAVIGFESVDEFSETNSVMVDARELFPSGSVSLMNIKIFSDTRIDEAIIQAASLACCSESITKSMFYEIIAGKTSILSTVESYIYEDSMGLCGWIDNKRVLLGNKKLMENHSIDGLPSAEKEREYTSGGRYIPVYLSISGELSAIFVINLVPVPEISHAVRELYRKDVKIILRSVDSAVTVERMAKMFHVSPAMLKILPFREHSEFEKATHYVPKQSAALACSGRFAAFASLILSTKRIRSTVSAGIAVQALSILLGILLSALLVLFKAYDDLSVAMILIYNLIFTAVYVMINFFRKV